MPTFAGYLTFFKAHERLLIIVAAIGLVWGVSGKVQDIIVAHDQKVYDAAQAARLAQDEKNEALDRQSAALAAQYSQIAEQLQAENAKLDAQNRYLADELKQQQAADAKLPAPALADRIEQLSGLPANTISVDAPGINYIIPAPGAVQIAQTLEQVPALQSQVSNLQIEKANGEKQLAEQGKVVDGLNVQVAGLKTEIKNADDAHAKEIKLVKAEAAKGKRKWFVAGYIAGLATRGVVKLFGL